MKITDQAFLSSYLPSSDPLPLESKLSSYLKSDVFIQDKQAVLETISYSAGAITTLVAGTYCLGTASVLSPAGLMALGGAIALGTVVQTGVSIGLSGYHDGLLEEALLNNFRTAMGLGIGRLVSSSLLANGLSEKAFRYGSQVITNNAIGLANNALDEIMRDGSHFNLNDVVNTKQMMVWTAFGLFGAARSPFMPQNKSLQLSADMAQEYIENPLEMLVMGHDIARQDWFRFFGGALTEMGGHVGRVAHVEMTDADPVAAFLENIHGNLNPDRSLKCALGAASAREITTDRKKKPKNVTNPWKDFFETLTQIINAGNNGQPTPVELAMDGESGYIATFLAQDLVEWYHQATLKGQKIEFNTDVMGERLSDIGQKILPHVKAGDWEQVREEIQDLFETAPRLMEVVWELYQHLPTSGVLPLSDNLTNDFVDQALSKLKILQQAGHTHIAIHFGKYIAVGKNKPKLQAYAMQLLSNQCVISYFNDIGLKVEKLQDEILRLQSSQQIVRKIQDASSDKEARQIFWERYYHMSAGFISLFVTNTSCSEVQLINSLLSGLFRGDCTQAMIKRDIDPIPFILFRLSSTQAINTHSSPEDDLTFTPIAGEPAPLLTMAIDFVLREKGEQYIRDLLIGYEQYIIALDNTENPDNNHHRNTFFEKYLYCNLYSYLERRTNEAKT